jgi:hypothetical protein
LQLDQQISISKFYDWGIILATDPTLLDGINIVLTVYSQHPKDVAKVEIEGSMNFHKLLKIRNYQAKELQEFCTMMDMNLKLIKKGKSKHSTN